MPLTSRYAERKLGASFAPVEIEVSAADLPSPAVLGAGVGLTFSFRLRWLKVVNPTVGVVTLTCEHGNGLAIFPPHSIPAGEIFTYAVEPFDPVVSGLKLGGSTSGLTFSLLGYRR